MASTNSTATKLTSVVALRALEPRNEPYWHKLGGTHGAFVGFRKTGPVGNPAGVWRGRLWHEGEDGAKRQVYETFPKAADFNDAVKQAHAWVAHLAAGVRADDIDVTVREACRRYAERVELYGVGKKGPRPETAKQLRDCYRRWIDSDKLGNVKLTDLKHHHLDDWRGRMLTTPIRGGGKRQPASMNRDMASVRAALNHAFKVGMTASNAAWRQALDDMDGAVKPRPHALDRAQLRDLIAECNDDLARFVEGLIRLPMRPGAVAQLDVGDFDPKTKVLTIRRDKAGKGRQIKLPAETAAFFARQCAHDGVRRMPSLPMFVRDAVNDEEGPQRWHKDTWKHPIKAAILAAGLPEEASAYTLRHSTITMMMQAGESPAVIAHIAGTSVAMIEKHYSHLQPDDALNVLAAVKL